MNKIYYMLMAVALTVMVGCQKENEFVDVQSDTIKTFYATFENGSDTRTALDDNNDVIWSVGDQISIFSGTTANNSFILNEGEGETSGTFVVNPTGTESSGSSSELSANVAYYPYDENVTVSEGDDSYTLNAVFPTVQTYSESGTFGNGASPMVAVTSNTDDTNLKFKNVGAIFRLQLKGEATITQIVFSANVDLAGECDITASNANESTTAPNVTVTEGSKTITLDCGEGVELSSEPTNFVIAMLPVEITTGGITITIYDNVGKKMVYKHKEGETITINRSQAYTTTEVTYNGNLDVDVNDVQSALDNATNGTIIRLEPGVDYGTLYIRPVMNADHTESGDWITNNYSTELLRKVENLTIIGALDAKVDAIEIVTGYKGSDYINEAPDLMCYADIKNLVIDGVEFTDNTTDIENYNSPIYISLQNTNLEGLTVKNCKLVGENPKTNLVYIYGSQGNHTFETASKNVTINGNTVDGIARLCELRETENVNISNNVIKNTTEHGILLAKDGVNYSGNVIITDNEADGIGDRFVRMAGAGNANVVIKNNVITNYKSQNYDYIKVTDHTGTAEIENNTCSYTVATADALQNALKAESDGAIITLAANDAIYEGLSFTNPANFKAKNLTIIGEDKDNTSIAGFNINGWSTDNNIEIDGLTFKNITFTSGLLLSTKVMANVKVENCNFVNDACIRQNDKTEKLTNLDVIGCEFTGDLSGTTTALMLENTKDVYVYDCTFNDIDFNVLQGGILTGDIIVDNNRVNYTGDRIFRFVTTEGAVITISNNTIVSNGDENGELAKATNPVEITLTNNTWNGMTDTEVAAKLINITAK